MNKELYSDSYMYALGKDIYPIFYETEESKYFESCYKIQKPFIEHVLLELERIDDEFLLNYRENHNEKEAYEKLPDYWSFIERLKINRHSDLDYQIYQVLRYLYLENSNFKYILSHFTENEKCPIEFKSITREFDISEIFNY